MPIKKELKMIFNEFFEKRLNESITFAWKIFQEKVGTGLIEINKEASMQLHYAYILQSILPLILFSKDESANVELEKTVNLGRKTREVDLFLTGRKEKKEYKIAIEMKCYRELAASGGKRGATDIFMNSVYLDIEKLEKYEELGLCDDVIFLAMNDFVPLIYPQNKKAKCWDYDISHGVTIGPKEIQTPIGGKEQNVSIKKCYSFNWEQNGKYYFLKL